jgi:hypothetical protein
VAHYNNRSLAILIVDADQIVGAKVRQRIKESVQKYAYFHRRNSRKLLQGFDTIYDIKRRLESRQNEIKNAGQKSGTCAEHTSRDYRRF